MAYLQDLLLFWSSPFSRLSFTQLLYTLSNKLKHLLARSGLAMLRTGTDLTASSDLHVKLGTTESKPFALSWTRVFCLAK